MNLFYAIIPLLIVIIPLIARRVTFKKIINGIFYGVLSALVASILEVVLVKSIFHVSNYYDVVQGVSISAFILALLFAAIPEELSKFLCIKFAKTDTKFNIFMNSMLVCATFACVENYLYYVQQGIQLGLTRLLHPGHMFFGLFMALFLIKSLSSNKKTYVVLAIAIPSLLHATFNTFVDTESMAYLFYIIGIITYIVIFVLLFKIPKEVQDESKGKFFILKLIVLILTFILMLILASSSNNSYGIEVNEKTLIKQNQIEITVHGYEKENISDYIVSSYNGDYIKVKVTINNLSENDFSVNVFDMNIVDSLNKNSEMPSLIYKDDALSDVKANESKTGYLYFVDDGKDYTYLIYSPSSSGQTDSYTFKLK